MLWLSSHLLAQQIWLKQGYLLKAIWDVIHPKPSSNVIFPIYLLLYFSKLMLEGGASSFSKMTEHGWNLYRWELAGSCHTCCEGSHRWQLPHSGGIARQCLFLSSAGSSTMCLISGGIAVWILSLVFLWLLSC